MTHPMAVTNCNIDMESLITDQNRSIATLAITTLLKTGDAPPTRPSASSTPWHMLPRVVHPLASVTHCTCLLDASPPFASCCSAAQPPPPPPLAAPPLPLHPRSSLCRRSSACTSGNEGSVDKLLKQIGGFMSDIADDFKIVVVEAIRSLCLKFPAKHRSLMNFLSNVLREEGGFDYKKSIVNAILALIQVGEGVCVGGNRRGRREAAAG